MTRKKAPPLGLMLLVVALGAGTAGYLLGRLHGEGDAVARTPGTVATRPPPLQADPWAEALGTLEGDLAEEAPAEEPAPAPAAEDGEDAGLTLEERIDLVRRLGDGSRSQNILIGLVAEAAARGGAMLPEIEELLDDGYDVAFTSWNGRGPGWPSLRVALLAAAEATGDPRAGEIIAEVARTTESPVELVFSAHLLDQLDRLDPETARRTLDSLAGKLSGEEKRAMASIVGKVVPAVAKANPEYAEYFVTTQLRATEGDRADPRLIAPAIGGLAPDRARTLVLDSMMARDVSENVKRMLGSRAAATGDVETLRGLQDVLASRTLDPNTTTLIARSAMSGRGLMTMERQARRALKQGDLAQATAAVREYEARLSEARRTVRVAGDAGARIPGELAKRDAIYLERLNGLQAQIAKEQRRREQEAAAR